MCKLDIENMSLKRKILLTVIGILYALAALGNARQGVAVVFGVTMFFAAVTYVLLLWVK